MFVKVLICICIPLALGLIEPNPQGEITLQELAHLVQNLTSEIMSMKKKQDAVVSFKAYLSQDKTVSVGSTLVFDHVESNLGNGYNPTSGVFHAPIAGIYTFSTLIDTLDDGDVDFALTKQGVVEMYLTLQDSYDSKSMTTTIHVDQGDDVFIRKDYDAGLNPRIRKGTWTQFSAHLLRAD